MNPPGATRGKTVLSSPKERIVVRQFPPVPMAHPGYQTDSEILAQEQARFFGQLVWGRVAVLPVLAGALIALAAMEPVGWRAGLLGTLAVSAPTFFVLELVRYRRRGLTARTVSLNLGAATIGQLLICVATGGLLSPFIYGIVLIAGMLGGALSGGPRVWLAGLQILAVWVLALAAAGWAPSLATSGILAAPAAGITAPTAYYATHALVLSVVTLGAGQAGRAMTRMFSTVIRRMLKVQQDLLAEHGDRVRDLTSLSAEIAHELKNPLASVKGLAALLAQTVTDPRNSERLAILRREVDRMQAILEEFLNFSRPLVPLTVVTSDAADLCFEVATLHEGLAQSRGVVLRCEGLPATCRCDPRKIKQILLNLVQNALDASSAGSTITLQSAPTVGGVVVRVIDEGQGLDPSLGNPFEPGVSSKSGGAGIGLTIARALAHQHGGELTIRAGDRRGCLAELFLPERPLGPPTSETTTQELSREVIPCPTGPGPALPQSAPGAQEARRR